MIAHFSRSFLRSFTFFHFILFFRFPLPLVSSPQAKKNHKNNKKIFPHKMFSCLTTDRTWNWFWLYQWFLFYHTLWLQENIRKKYFCELFQWKKGETSELWHATAMKSTFVDCFQLTNENLSTWKSCDALLFLRSDGKLLVWRHGCEKRERMKQSFEPIQCWWEAFIGMKCLKYFDRNVLNFEEKSEIIKIWWFILDFK